MKLSEAFSGLSLLFLDTAPVIYQVEKNQAYCDLVAAIFKEVDAGQLQAVTSPITLTECLVFPYRLGAVDRVQEFVSLIVSGRNTRFVTIDERTGQNAAELRARYNLGLPDALQIACALEAGCDGFLTNDLNLRRVTELRVLALDDLTL